MTRQPHLQGEPTTMTAKPLRGFAYIEWAREEAAAQRSWASMNVKEPARLEAFEEGFRQGYLRAIAAMILHGHIVEGRS